MNDDEQIQEYEEKTEKLAQECTKEKPFENWWQLMTKSYVCNHDCSLEQPCYDSNHTSGTSLV